MAGMPTSSSDMTMRDGNGLLGPEATPSSPAARMRGGILPSSNMTGLPTSSTDTTTQDGDAGIHGVAPDTGRSPLPTTGPGIARVNASLAAVGQKLEELKDFAEKAKAGNMRLKASAIGLAAKEADENVKILSEMVKLWREGEKARVSALADIDREMSFKKQELSQLTKSTREELVSIVSQFQDQEIQENSRKIQQQNQQIRLLVEEAERAQRSIQELEIRRNGMVNLVASLGSSIESLKSNFETDEQYYEGKIGQYRKTLSDVAIQVGIKSQELAQLNTKLIGLSNSVRDREVRLSDLDPILLMEATRERDELREEPILEKE